MNSWTPDTRTMREYYVRFHANRHCADPDLAGEQFDRWLDQVKAEAWDAGYLAHRQEMNRASILGLKSRIPNPYRKEAP